MCSDVCVRKTTVRGMTIRRSRHPLLVATLLLFLVTSPSASYAAVIVVGDVGPSNPITWTSGTVAYVGQSGTGTVTIDGGSTVQSSNMNLGYGVGSVGTVTVTGAGSNVKSYGLDVGYSGNGILTVNAGGQVFNLGSGYLGYNAGSNGTATVTGSNSKWGNSYDLYVGMSGGGTLTVADGGEVDVSGTLYAPLDSLLGNGTIKADSAVLDGDFAFSGTASQPISFGTGGTLSLSLTGNAQLGAGYKGIGSLQMSNGIAIASSNGYLGYNAGSSGAATVTGTGTKWTIRNDFYVGKSGTGTLAVTDGGAVLVGGTFYASLSNLSGNGTITANGAVLDADLAFDATHGLQQAIPFGTGGA